MSATRTFHTVLDINPESDVALQAYAALLSQMDRKIFAAKQAAVKVEDTVGLKNRLKTQFIKKYAISGRQFNSCWAEIDGLMESNRSNLKNHITELKEKIKSAKKTVEKIKKQKNYDRFNLHQKKRRLFNLEQKLGRWEEDYKSKRVRLAFGSKKLFRAQFNLKENRLEDHAEWYAEWNRARNNQFFLIGSHDESCGNQTCQMTENPDGTFNITLRLPDALVDKYGKHIQICNIKWTNATNTKIDGEYNAKAAYRYKAISAAVQENKERSAIPVKNKKRAQKARTSDQLSILERQKKGRWRLYAMLDAPEADIISRDYMYGVISVDINQDHLAIVETDRFGNPIKSGSISCVTHGKSSDQSVAIIGEVDKELIEWAIAAKKPIVLEDLDFKKKKAQLEEFSKARARQLSSFAYSAIIRIIQSRAYKSGIETYQVNPAFTSLIGRLKFATRYGLTIHQGAALAIGRRKMRFSERPPKSTKIKFEVDTDIYGTFHSPVRMNWKHVWCWWKGTQAKLKSAVARHYRKRKAIHQSQAKSQSGNIPPRDGVDQVGCDEKSSVFLGEIPKRRRHNCSGAADSFNESDNLLTFVNEI